MAEGKKWVPNILIDDYETYLRTTCGASPGTCQLYRRNVERFIKLKFGDQEVNWSTLQPFDLITFVINQSSRYQPETTRSLSTALRSFLRFLQTKGLCLPYLVEAVPSIVNHRLAGLPATLSAEQVTRLLSSFNRSNPIGLRGYAMVCCLTFLGLRADEVAHLSLDDIHWKKATLLIPKTKPRRESLLPLPDPVGEAIVDYLQHGRPSTPERRIFVSHQQPVGNPLSSSAVRIVVRRAFQRANLDTASTGTHILRQTLATHLIHKGVSLKEIADVLRHQHLNTTLIYTKVDLPMLAEVAMPWPEVSQ